jgi:endonuclease I
MHDSSFEMYKYRGDSIQYSGYNGVDGRPGNEFIEFGDATDRAYEMYAFGYAAGDATVSYSWTGRSDCTSATSGSGSFQQDISQGNAVTVGILPAGLTDVFIRLESTKDVDVQLYDGLVPVVDWKNGPFTDKKSFARVYYEAAGVQVEYSGYHGEQSDNKRGYEYVRLGGTLTKSLSLRVLGYEQGRATVIYNWGYYNNVVMSSLKSSLHLIIDGHLQLSYTDCWDALQTTDQDDSNPDNVILLYSRRSQPKISRDNGSGGDLWNREHVWAKSHGDFATSRGPGTDLHHLRPSDASVNADRGSKDFDEGGGLLNGDSGGDCPSCLKTADTFEPPDEIKGDIARMLFYMAVRYEGDSGEVDLEMSASIPTQFGSSTKGTVGRIGKLSTLLKWHVQDPVSDEEYHRNNKIHNIQGNRNPFIDHPEWASLIF